MKQAILSNGIKIPYVGLGAFQTSETGNAYNAIRSALDLGYHYIDTAMNYKYEESIGKAIKNSKVKREKIFLSSKLWDEDIRSKHVRKAFELSLKRLQVEYLDLYLVHWPIKGHYLSVWSEMEAIYKTGQVKAIGVSNFDIPLLNELLSVCTVAPMVNQFESHPYNSQNNLVNYCKKHQIQSVAYSPLCARMKELLENPLLTSLAKKYSKTAAQIIIRWNIEREVVVLPKSLNRKQQEENSSVFDFTLSIDDTNKISTLNRGVRVEPNPKNHPFVHL